MARRWRTDPGLPAEKWDVEQRGGWFYNRRRVEDATGQNDLPEERMQLIREYIDSAKQLKDQAAEAERAKQAASAPHPQPGSPPPTAPEQGAPMPMTPGPGMAMGNA